MKIRSILTMLAPVVLALALGWWMRGLQSDDAPASDGGAQSTAADGPCPGGAGPVRHGCRLRRPAAVR